MGNWLGDVLDMARHPESSTEVRRLHELAAALVCTSTEVEELANSCQDWDSEIEIRRLHEAVARLAEGVDGQAFLHSEQARTLEWLRP